MICASISILYIFSSLYWVLSLLFRLLSVQWSSSSSSYFVAVVVKRDELDFLGKNFKSNRMYFSQGEDFKHVNYELGLVFIG